MKSTSNLFDSYTHTRHEHTNVCGGLHSAPRPLVSKRRAHAAARATNQCLCFFAKLHIVVVVVVVVIIVVVVVVATAAAAD